MKKYIFDRVQQEIELLDDKITLFSDPFIKSLRFNNYSLLSQCLLNQKPSFQGDFGQLQAFCLKEVEAKGGNLKEIIKEINGQKEELYHCVNKSYVMSDDDLDSIGNKRIVIEVDDCLNKFKRSVIGVFKKEIKH